MRCKRSVNSKSDFLRHLMRTFGGVAQKIPPQPHYQETATGYGRLLQPHQPDHESGRWVACVDWDYFFFN